MFDFFSDMTKTSERNKEVNFSCHNFSAESNFFTQMYEKTRGLV